MVKLVCIPRPSKNQKKCRVFGQRASFVRFGCWLVRYAEFWITDKPPPGGLWPSAGHTGHIGTCEGKVQQALPAGQRRLEVTVFGRVFSGSERLDPTDPGTYSVEPSSPEVRYDWSARA